MVVLEKAARVPSQARATGLSLISWALFASSGSLAKAVMAAGWSAAAVTSVRIALAAVLLVPVVGVLRPRALQFRRADLWLLLSYGLLGVAGVQLFFFVAVARVPIGVAMVLVNLAPALVALWVRVVRRIRLPGLVWLGIGLAVAGLALVAEIWEGARLDMLGVAAGLAAAICSAGYFLLGEHGASRHDPFGLTAAGLAIGAVVVVAISPPWTLPTGLTDPAVLGGLRTPVWLALLLLAVVGTVLPYLAGLRALRDLPSATASVLAMVEPLVAAGLAWLLLGQALGLTQLAGSVILLIGAVLVQFGRPGTAPGQSGGHSMPAHEKRVVSSPYARLNRPGRRTAGACGACAYMWDVVAERPKPPTVSGPPSDG
ncbi:EamA family transporter [Nocardia sp. NBC_00881]|uniref:EamA family transporter n=1 Tax=Nocardia sp. NBC_00881 TaxID=2975995 RepID=UPI00386AD862|nr:EamA family transporter [Nocardia sp. NBC_00881]